MMYAHAAFGIESERSLREDNLKTALYSNASLDHCLLAVLLKCLMPYQK